MNLTVLKSSWWWFDSVKKPLKCQSALAWEVIRRTTSYQSLWRKYGRECAARRAAPATGKMAEVFKQIDLFQRTREAATQLFFKLLANGFDPGQSWLALSPDQRNEKLYLPRQISDPPVDSLLLGFGQIETETAPPLFNKLGLTPAQYFLMRFDTRLERESLHAAAKAKMASLKHLWTKKTASGGSGLLTTRVNILPTTDPAFALFVAPAGYDKERYLAAFYTQLKTRQRKKWQDRCVRYWKTLFVEELEAVRNSKGQFLIGAEMLPRHGKHTLPLYQKVRRPLFNPETDLPLRLKPTKSAVRANLWLGLAANDVMKKRKSLGKTSDLGLYLLNYCSTTVELRNHQHSAAKRLKELDRWYGRVDKTFALAVARNAQLEKTGIFSAGAEDRSRQEG